MGQSSEKRSESFGQYVTRISAFAAAISGGLLFFEISPDVENLTRKVLGYAIGTWILFAVVPFLFRLGWKHRSQIKWKWLLVIFVVIADHISQRKKNRNQDNEQNGSLSYPLPENETGAAYIPHPEDETKSGVISGSYQQQATGLPDVFNLLPFNPRPHPSHTITKDMAADAIHQALEMSNFNVEEKPQILSVESGPTLQKISFSLPPKVQLSKLVQRKEDLANHLGHSVGFDVDSTPYPSSAAFVIPHAKRAFVYIRDVMDQFIPFAQKSQLPVVFGKSMNGEAILVDLAKLPHLLVAGTTGSGKSVFINALIGSLELVRSPEQVKFVMIDPKMVEFMAYADSPHLLLPVVTDLRRAAFTLQKVVVEMEKRYQTFAAAGVRNIEQYNRNHETPMPYIVVLVDEYADLMLVVKDQVEEAVQRLAQMGRAAGVHLVLGTQRPSVNVITGVIKSNLPSRVAFRLPSPQDFRTVMDGSGPHLLDRGDGVCLFSNGSRQRFQSAAVTGDDNESVAFIKAVSKYWKTRSPSVDMSWSLDEQATENEISEVMASASDQQYEIAQSSLPIQEANSEGDPESQVTHDIHSDLVEVDPESMNVFIGDATSYESAIQVAQKHQGISPLLLQKMLSIDYMTAARMVERMQNEGIVGEIDFDKGMRPWLRAETKETEAELLHRMKLYICKTKTARVGDLQNEFSIRREKVSQLMSKLCEEGMLNSPTSPKVGYTIAWKDDQIDAFLEA
ncbi:DNA segregation ATPase FtsK/SpoIIIE-like protein [Fontibacillus solani]|uniref:DNA segregation ATPase FtsK/SpoIIIE-like protein n=1 Tax=Fontibacillus solani TaxID=1572857 RepID=A0A7W3SUS9_9BACL|nr:FtsK/SpoIIIE domain-containing protein [Fontibacillus solani]MBA9086503.1 DNA segregation ATPase FtsK/SpoIIIE-like protein [Fontibacillus solani]